MTTHALRHRFLISTLIVAAVGVGAMSGCQTSKPVPVASEAVLAITKDLPVAADALKPLTFMAGAWVAVNPNKSVNREQWMAPMGTAMTGVFQQMRRDGNPTFYEVTTIVVEKSGVKLYHRHVHIKLEVDERRKDVDVFTLASSENNAAVFMPVADVDGGLKSMTYRADGPDKLIQEIAFKPGSKEKDFSTVYVREAAR